MNIDDRYAKIREALEMEVSSMHELPRDLVTILRTEASNQRTPPIDYVIAEDGGRMVHTPEPDIAMAELLEEVAAAIASGRAALAEARWARDDAFQRYVDANKARIDAEARLAKALKALEQIEQQLDYGQIDTALHITRRALGGGE